MSRNKYAFNVLQATALVASLAVILWSLGFPTLQFAQAANVTSFTNTLSDSAPSVDADHTVEFVAPTGVAATETIVLSFDAAFDLTGVLFSDIDLIINGSDATLAAAAASGVWGVTVGASSITFTSNDTTVAAGNTVEILIGTNAASGVNQITNPATPETSYEINVLSGTSDTGETRVAIVTAVTVTATVDTIFTFNVAGVAGGVTVNGTDVTGGTTTATTIPFGELQPGVASTAAQTISVTTNASNGFVVTAQVNQQLTSSNGADIDGFIEGNFTTTPTAWASPVLSIADENTYGHWGISSNDATLTAGLSDLYTGGLNFVSASTTPVEVFRHDGPINSTVAGEGFAEVIYKAEVTSLQEAAEDYIATLTYVATPVF